MSSSFTGVTLDAGYLLGPQCFSVQASMSFLTTWMPNFKGVLRERERKGQVEPDVVSKDMHCCFCHILVLEAGPKSCLGLRGGDMDSISWLGVSRFCKNR